MAGQAGAFAGVLVRLSVRRRRLGVVWTTYVASGAWISLKGSDPNAPQALHTGWKVDLSGQNVDKGPGELCTSREQRGKPVLLMREIVSPIAAVQLS